VTRRIAESTEEIDKREMTVGDQDIRRISINSRDLIAFEQEMAVRAVDEFSVFYRWAWNIIEPGALLEWGWHLDAICEHLEAVSRGEIKRLSVEMPTGFTKSVSCAVMWPAWQWARNPSWRLLCSTHSHGLSKRDSGRRRDIITDPDYQRLFASGWALSESKGHEGDPAQGWTLAEDQAEKVFFKNTRGGHMVALSVGASVTGHRGDTIITDDLLDVEQAYSDPARKRALDHFRRVLPTRVNDLRTARWIHVQQRTGMEDPSALAREWGFEVLSLPLEYDPKRSCVTVIGWEDPREEPGELLDPVRVGPDEVAFLKQTLGARDFETQQNQNPSPVEGGVIKRAWVNQRERYRELPSVVVDKGEWCISVDPKAGSKNPKSAYAVIQVWVRHKATFWLVDQRRGRWSFVETVSELKAMAKRWPRATRKLVEAKGDGLAIVEVLAEQVPGVVPVRVGANDGEKVERLRAVSPIFEAGNIRLPDEFPSADADNTVEIWIHELTSSMPAKFMDQADTATQMLNHWRSRAFRRVDGPEKERKPRRRETRGADRLRRLSGRNHR
jgi:predicted phage terminase large subunit-like protein